LQKKDAGKENAGGGAAAAPSKARHVSTKSWADDDEEYVPVAKRAEELRPIIAPAVVQPGKTAAGPRGAGFAAGPREDDGRDFGRPSRDADFSNFSRNRYEGGGRGGRGRGDGYYDRDFGGRGRGRGRRGRGRGYDGDRGFERRQPVSACGLVVVVPAWPSCLVIHIDDGVHQGRGEL
jgi:hypothetical protein